VTTPLTTTSHAILGLLCLRSWSTYELAKQAQRSLDWFWPRAERKLYEEPKRLVTHGLARSDKEMTGARPRTVYAVTRKGRQTLTRWLSEPPAPPVLEFEGMVKVFFADGGTIEQLRANLTCIADTAEQRLFDLRVKIDELEESGSQFEQRVHLNALGLRFHLEHERTLRDWAHWALDQVDEWDSTTDPGLWDHRRAWADLGDGSDEMH